MRTRTIIAGAASAAALLAAGCGGEDDSADVAPATDTSAARTATAASAPPAEDACFDEGKKFQGVARLYIEYNATDRDVGTHGTFDQEGLSQACLRTPDGTRIMSVDPTGRLDDLGINQFFFESREPPAREYSIADSKAEFPEGEYRISGIDYKGDRRVGTARYTHAIPAPPEITAPKIVPEERGEKNVLPAGGMTVRWKPVDRTVDGEPVELAGYQVIVTQEEYDNPDAVARPEYSVHIPADQTELDVPPGFLRPGTLYELEVLSIEDSGNQTITVGYFTTRGGR